MHLPLHDACSVATRVDPLRLAEKCLLLILGMVLACGALSAAAQSDVTNESLLIKAGQATTWGDGTTNILQIETNVSIDLDQTHLTADGAVIWLTPTTGAVLEEQRAEISLVGHAAVTQADGVSRTAETLFVTATIRGSIRLTADERQVENKSTTDLFKRALMIRPSQEAAAQRPGDTGSWLIQRPWTPSPATTQAVPTSQPAAVAPIFISADQSEATKTTDGLIATVLTGNVKLFQKRPMGEFLELRADRVVVFTTLHDLSEMQKKQYANFEQAITGAYLEGDVRLVFTPAIIKRTAEQRLTGKRVFYDFTTDRAILTEAVVHTYSPKTASPIILRAQIVRQLSAGEYTASKAQLTTSSFATPSYSIGLGKAYVRQVETGDPTIGTYTEFSGDDVTFQLYNTPVFYYPHVGGTMDERGSVFRNISASSGSRFGPGLITQWGLFETLGKVPPRGTDITYQLDYFGKRGPAAGVDGKYQGGTVTDTTRDPWDFTGDFSGFFVEDHGKDKLDNLRPTITPPTGERGRFFLEHQHFLPDDWQMQLSLGYSSDPTFLEEWYQDQFYTRRPQETALYLKHQRDSEALTFLVSKQLNNFVTSSDLQQEQAEVERLPEIGYRRIGDSLLNDSTTFFSENTISGLDFHRSRASLADQAFAPGQTPGLPSYGTTGEPTNLVYRGDFRQELDYPFSAGQFRVVPYVLGRYTVYSDSPTSGGIKNRLYTGAGLRASTAFWKVDDSVESSLFDLHRLRHVIEPEVNVFTGAQNVNRSRLFQYDESVDEINDITGAQLALRQRWQTKRGGPGRWRSVDVFSFNVEGNFFTRKPQDALISPTKFRGLFFNSVPEESIPRNSVNADANWRISDTTEIISDVEYNLDQRTLATASAGLAVQRGERISYFLGQRYIEPLKSNITTFAANYQITSKYVLSFRQSFDFGLSRNVASEISFIRHFDRFYASVSLRYDEIGNNSGFMINLIPEGFSTAGVGGSGTKNVFQR
jgi:lipopolysaccharide export system protein LptA